MADEVYCLACGYKAKDETDMLAHLIECPGNPEEKWITYIDMDLFGPGYKNSDILKEE